MTLAGNVSDQCLRICRVTTRDHTRYRRLRMVIGRENFGSVACGFFAKGMTRACVNHAGNPCFAYRLKTSIRSSKMLSGNVLSSSAFHPQTPVAVLDLTLAMASFHKFMSVVLTCICCASGTSWRNL